MAKLFGRRAVLQMGTVEVDGLRVSFKVEKDDQPEPNAAEVSVWNLSRDTRASFIKQTVPLILQAGYADEIEQLFTGNITPDGIATVRDGADWVTTFKAGDGAAAYRSARVQEAFAKGAQVTQVMEKLAKSLGVGLGNAIETLRKGDVRGALSTFFGGTTLSGMAKDELTHLCDSLGYGWSVQDDQLQIVEKGKSTADAAVLLTTETGLIGSPEPGKDGITKFRSLLQPQIKPGRLVQIDSASIDNGVFVVKKVTHTGDTMGQDWYSDCEAKVRS